MPDSADTRKSLQRLFDPASIAIVGASADLESFNGRVLKNLLRHGYPGRVYPVNPKYPEAAGLRCYPSVRALPEAPDTAFIAVGRSRVREVMAECAALGVPTATIYTHGFSEIGEEGVRLEEEVRAIAETAGIRVCGPNTSGYHNFHRGLHLAGVIALDVETPIPGNIGVLCQSGSIGAALLSRATQRGIGFSFIISCGNEMDLETSDYLEYLVDDENTRSIALYLEGLRDARKFLRAAEAALRAGKPIAVCKVGRSAAGHEAALSHTGALVGEDRAYEAAFRQWGIARVDDLEQLLEVSHMFAVTPLPRGRKVGIVTTTGGGGALVADGCGALGLEVPPLDETLAARFRASLPEGIALGNPIDTTIAGIASYGEMLRTILAEGGFDIVVPIVGSSSQFRPEIGVAPLIEAKEKGLTERTAVLVYFNPYAEEAHRLSAAAGLASFNTTEGCVRAAGHLVRYAEFRERWGGGAGAGGGSRLGRAGTPRPESGGVLSEARSLALAEAFGLRVVPRRLCGDPESAALAAEELGYPVALKVSSPDIPHKTEAGLVAVGIADADSLCRAFSQMADRLAKIRPRPSVEGYLVEKMVEGGAEFLLGVVRDRQFGPLVTVGLGGVAAEAMADVSIRLAPVSLAEAEKMLEELRGSALLGPFRGRGPLDRHALAEAVERLGGLAASLGDVLLEADFNPVFVMPEGEGYWVADALTVWEEEKASRLEEKNV